MIFTLVTIIFEIFRIPYTASQNSTKEFSKWGNIQNGLVGHIVKNNY